MIVRLHFTAVALLFFLLVTVMPCSVNAQAILEADGPGNTYELINSILSPGYTAVESPDQCTSHPSFGRHIAEVWDATLGKYVFEFYIHVSPDNDRCINFDRQRVEIKTYDQSSDTLKGTIGETVNYKWRFRLPSGYQPSPNFSHIHQVKAVGGDDDDPIFTLTVRAGGVNTLQLIYDADSSAAATTLTSAPLSSFLGTWVEATETVKVGASGSYSIVVKRVSDGVTLLSFNIANIATIRPSNSFIRPKWGIYRSLNNPSFLRDDSIRFANISIYEGVPPLAPSAVAAVGVSSSQINLSWTDNSTNERRFNIEQSPNGATGWVTIATLNANATSFSHVGLAANTVYFYRIQAENPAGVSSYSVVVQATTNNPLPVVLKSFSGTNNGYVSNLSWLVGEEINLKHYEVEYSKDGLTFMQALIIPATNKSSYNAQHINVTGTCFYRLKMMNQDGTFTYSKIIFISNSMPTSIRVSPNPSSGWLTLTCGTTNIGSEYAIVTTSGKILLSGSIQHTTTLIGLQQLLSGNYYLVMTSEKNIRTTLPFILK